MTAAGNIMGLDIQEMPSPCGLLNTHIILLFKTLVGVYGGCCVGEGLWLQVWLGVGLASVVIAVFLLQRYFDAAGLLGETGAQCAF